MPPSTAQATAPAGLPIWYPTTLIDARCWSGAQRLLLRPVLPQDEHLFAALMLAQSAQARHNRFHAAVKPSPGFCRQMSRVDYRQQLALVVCSMAGGVEALVADARYGVAVDGLSAEFALIVDERWQRQGIGRWLLLALQQAAAIAGLKWLEGEVLQDNHAMLGLAQRCGFARMPGSREEPVVRVRRQLAAADANEALANATNRPPGPLQRLALHLGLHFGQEPARSPRALAASIRPCHPGC